MRRKRLQIKLPLPDDSKTAGSRALPFCLFFFEVGVLTEHLKVAWDGAAAVFVEVATVRGGYDDLEVRGDAGVGVYEIGGTFFPGGRRGEDVVVVGDLVQAVFQASPEAVEAFAGRGGALQGLQMARGVLGHALHDVAAVEDGLLLDLAVEDLLPPLEFRAEGGGVDLLDAVQLEGPLLILEDIGAQRLLEGIRLLLASEGKDAERRQDQDFGGSHRYWCASLSRSRTTFTGLKVSMGTSTKSVFQSDMEPFQRPGSSSALSSRPW